MRGTAGYQFLPFAPENIRHIVDTVLPLWGVPERSERLNRICVEYIVRRNIFENDLNLQCVSKDGFCAAAFACRPHDTSKAEQWLSALTPPLDEQEAQALALSRAYITAMDSRTLSFMSTGDIKLSLFVSHRKGAGLPLFTEFAGRLAAVGYQNLYLWTDCDCTWEWYPRHGFLLVEEGTYDAFSCEGEPYRTFIFKKELP